MKNASFMCDALVLKQLNQHTVLGPCTYYITPNGGGGVGLVHCYHLSRRGGEGGQVMRCIYVTTADPQSRPIAGLPMDIPWITSIYF